MCEKNHLFSYATQFDIYVDSSNKQLFNHDFKNASYNTVSTILQ